MVEVKTEAEAKAFASGVEYVNDSAIVDVKVFQDHRSNCWVVTWWDNDQGHGGGDEPEPA